MSLGSLPVIGMRIFRACKTALFLGLLSFFLGGLPPAARAVLLSDDAVVAKVGVTSIRVAGLKKELHLQMTRQGYDPQIISQSNYIFMSQQVLERLIDRDVVRQMADEELLRQAEKEAEKAADRALQSAGSAEAWSKKLESMSLSEEQFREIAAYQYLVVTLARREGFVPPNPSPGDVERYYQGHLDSWKRGEKLRVVLVVCRAGEKEARDKKTADAIGHVIEIAHRRISSGESPAAVVNELARQFPRLEVGGAAVNVVEGKGAPAIRKAALATPPGKISGIFPLGDGIAFVKTLERTEAGLVPLDEARPLVERLWTQEKSEQMLNEVRWMWRNRMGVESYLMETSLRLPRGPLPSGGLKVAIVVVMVLVACLVGWGVRRSGANGASYAVWLCAGTVYAALWMVTPFDIRSADPEAHLEYIRYVELEWKIPERSEGFMFYQPPLYYFLAAAFSKMTAGVVSPPAIQALGVLLTWLAMGSAIWLLEHVALRLQADRWALAGSQAALALLPSVAFLAPRVGNDVLVFPLEILAVLFLVLWWEQGRRLHWLLSVGALALALLTKGNALLLLPVLGGCLFLRPQTRKGEWLWLALCASGVLLVACGWFYYLRFVTEGQTDLAGNLPTLKELLRIRTDGSSLTYFHPWEILRHPFVNDAFQGLARDGFWGYFFRTALFGHYAFPFVPPVFVSSLVVSAMVILAFVAWAVWSANRNNWREWLPFTLLLFVLLAGHIAYRQIAPYASSQNFRYSLPLLLPLAVFYLYGLRKLPARWMGLIPVWIFVVSSLVIVGHVVFQS